MSSYCTHAHGAVVGSECIRLNEAEDRIFNLLTDCCAYFKMDVTLRIAGGWVRDKVCASWLRQ